MTNTDLIKIAKQLDKIITSERPEVKEAFRELLIVSALIEGDGVKGPISTLVDKVNDLSRDVAKMSDRLSIHERELSYRNGVPRPRSYHDAIEQNRIWGGTVPDDQTNPFKRLYETTYLNNPYEDDNK